MPRCDSALRTAFLAGIAALCANCSSPSVNPPTARAHKGYVDFYSPGNTNLAWGIKRADPQTGAFQPLLSRPKPLPDPIVRLELDPGLQRFQITFLNRVIAEPLTLDVPVREGLVTPVQVELVPAGETNILATQKQFGANVRGAGRKTRYSSEAGAVERPVAVVQPPLPYRPKQQMNYPP